MSKVVAKGMDIPLDKIKPSPYQPRLNFDLEDIRESIERDGILIGLTVRQVNEYYELIDGERRLRLAKELGYETLPCDIVDIDDETARRMVYKVNKARKNYTTYEEAVFFRKLVEEEKMKPYEVETQLGVHHAWVQACLNIWKFPKEIQDNVLGLSRGTIPYRVYMTDIRELEPVINRNLDEAIEILRQIIKERMTPDEKDELISGRKKKIDEDTLKKAKEAIEEIAPELDKPKTPEDFEKAAKALLDEAKRLKTPEQILEEKLEEKREQTRKALLTGKGNAKSKIEKASEEGLDTSEFEKRLEEIKEKISEDPEGAFEDSKEFKKEIDAARKEHKAILKAEKEAEKAKLQIKAAMDMKIDTKNFDETIRNIESMIKVDPQEAFIKSKKLKDDVIEAIKAEEMRLELERIREEERKKAEEKRIEDLVKDHPQAAQEVIIDMRTDQLKRGIETKGEELTEKEVSELKKILEAEQKRIKKRLNDPKIRERGMLFRNLMAHSIILQYEANLFCPSHGKDSGILQWGCCSNSIDKAYKELSSKF